MTTRVPYRIVIPSHRRVSNIPAMLRFFPDATICVDQEEADDYARVVPEEQLLLHPSVDTLPKIRNWILDNVSEPAVVQIDDDLKGVLSMVWRRPRRITDGRIIRQLIENGINIASDLGKSAYCWGRMRVALGDGSPCIKPFAFTRLMSSSFVIIGRKFRFDPHLPFNADLDFTLQLLLHERVLIQDTRFYFDHGSIEGGGGGAQAKRTNEDMQWWLKHIKHKWKAHIQTGMPSVISNVKAPGSKRASRPGNLSNRITVRRKSVLGSK